MHKPNGVHHALTPDENGCLVPPTLRLVEEKPEPVGHRMTAAQRAELDECVRQTREATKQNVERGEREARAAARRGERDVQVGPNAFVVHPDHCGARALHAKTRKKR